MQFASLGSGSKGNAALVKSGDTCVLVDCGFGIKTLEERLAFQQTSLNHISAVLITHEHGDHIKGLASLLRRRDIPVYLTLGTAEKLPKALHKHIQIIAANQPFNIHHLRVHPVAVPHDAQEPVQFVFYSNGLKLGILSDLGSITSAIIQAYNGCDALMLEANYCPTLLAYGPYPASLKKRVAGSWGHLSNDQTAHLLSQLDTQHLQHLVIGHISQHNNTPQRTAQALNALKLPIPYHLASQEQGFNWLHIHPRHPRGHTHAA